MSEIPETPEDGGITTAASAAISKNVSIILDSATTAVAAAPALSATIRTAEEVPGLHTASVATAAASNAAAEIAEKAAATAAAVSSTVAGMLERATISAAAPSEVPVLEISTTEAASTAVATKMTTVPPLSPPGLSTEHPMSSIELSSRADDRGDDRATENDTNPVLELENEVNSQTSPAPQQPKSAGAAVDAAGRSRKNQRELAPVVLSDAGRLFYADAKVSPHEGRDEKEKKGDKKGDKEWDENQGTRGEKEKRRERVSDESKEAKGGGREMDEDCDSRVVFESGPEDGASVWVFGRREGAVVQVR